MQFKSVGLGMIIVINGLLTINNQVTDVVFIGHYVVISTTKHEAKQDLMGIN